MNQKKYSQISLYIWYNTWCNSLCLGAFTPETMDGTKMVDGVLASCDAFSDYDMDHIGITPIRWFPIIIEKIFGNSNESPTYVNVLDDFARILLPFGIN